MSGPRTRTDGAQQGPAVAVDRQKSSVLDSIVFANAPVSLWHEDFSAVKQRIDRLSQQGIKDFRKYFNDHAEVVSECANLVKIIDVNRASVDLWRAKRKQDLTDSLTRTFIKQSYDVFREELIALATGDMSFQTDTVGQTLDGERIDTMLRMFVDPDSPNWSSVYLAFTDVTERVRAEEALKNANDQLADRARLRNENLKGANRLLEKDLAERNWLTRIYKEAPVGLCCFDTQLRYLDINENLAALNGLSVEDHLGHSVSELFPDLAAGNESQLRQVIETGEPIIEGSVLAETPARPGIKRHFHGNCYPVESADGAIVGVSCAVIEVTELKQTERAVKDSQALYKSLVDNLEQCVFRKDLNGRVTFLNQQYCDLLGKPLEAWIGLTDADVFPPELAAKYQADDRRVVETGETFESVEEHRSPDGETSYVRVIKTPVYDSDHEVIGVQGTFWDITEKRLAEEALKKAHDELEVRVKLRTAELEAANAQLRTEIEERKLAEKSLVERDQLYRAAISTADAVAYQFNYETNSYDYLGDGIEKLIGHKAADVTPAIWEAITRQRNLLGEATGSSRKEANRRFRVGELNLWKAEYQCVLEDGREVWLFDSSVPVRNDEGRVFGSLGILQDITERKQTEESLRLQNAVFEAAMDGILITDAKLPDNPIIYSSPAFQDCTGYSAEEVTGKNCRFLQGPGSDATVVAQIRDAINQGSRFSGEILNYRKNGEPFWNHLRLEPFHDSDGNLTHFVGIQSDVTERKNAENELSTIFEMSLDLICAADVETAMFTRINPAFVRTLGYSELELLSRSFLELIHPDDVEPTLTILERDLKQGKSVLNFENRYLTKGGDYRWLSWSARPNLATGLTYAMGRDVTEQKAAEQSLRESETKSRSLLEGSPVCNKIIDLDSKLRYMSAAGRNQLKISDIEPFYGTDFPSDLYPESYREPVIECLERAKAGDVSNMVCPVHDTEGALIWFDTTFVPARDKEGRVEHVIVTSVNVTERKAAEEALRRSEERLDLAIRGTSDGLWDWEIESGKEYWSPRFKELLGYEEDEIDAGHDQFLAFLHPEDKAGALAAIRLHLEQNVPYDSEFRMLTKSGDYCWVQSRGRAYRDSNGQPHRMTGSIRDITERKQAEEALHASEEKLRLLFETSPLGMTMSELDGTYVQANQAYLNILGYTHEEAVGLSCRDVTPTDYDEVEAEQYRSLEETGRYGPYVKEYVRKNGKRIPVLLNGMIVKGANGVERIWSLVEDITERKRADEENKRLQEQLRHTQKMEAIGQLAAGVAHEFNNILVGVRNNAEFLLRTSTDLLPEDLKRPLRDIERSGARGFDLTQQLLSFTRKKVPNLAIFDINRVVTYRETMLQRLIGTKIQLVTEISPEPALVMADEADLEQALMNLVMNARDAMQDRGSLTIRTRSVSLEQNEVPLGCEAGRYVRLTVADDGCGMSPETVERIFEPFFTTKPVGSGTGLGLSSVYSDITKAGGFVSVESREGVGTIVDILLPQSQDSFIDKKSEVESTPASLVGGQETILVCDDDEVVLDSLTVLLKSVGYTVIAVSSAREALDAAAQRTEAISLLLTDVTMPDMDGLQLGREFRRLYPKIKTIYSTGYAADRANMGGAGEDAVVVTKGGPGIEMIQQIREVLDKSRASDR